MSSKKQIDYCRWYHPDLAPKSVLLSYWIIVSREKGKRSDADFATLCFWDPEKKEFREFFMNNPVCPRLVMVLPRNDQFYPTLEP